MHRTHQNRFQALGEIGPTEEFHRVPVLIRSLAEMHLPEVRRELGLLVAAAGHILVRRDHLPPGLEMARGRAFDSGASALALFMAHLLVENQASELHLHLADLVGLGCGNSGKKPHHGVQGPVRVVA